MTDRIYLIDGASQLTELHRSDYSSEDLFQSLLGEHPALLRLAAGPQGALLLVKREQAVPDRVDGSDRWSLDHLFLDRDAVPVLVEVKQARDTRARREVVAQMLDYAANGIAYWSIEQIIAAFRATAQRGGRDPDDLLSSFLDDTDPEAYWRQVEANLRSGRIRMLFVADRIPKELARIVEFLNEQMRPAEVLAIEVEQFVNAAGVRTLVPRLVGATERARTAKAVGGLRNVQSEAEWLDELEGSFGSRSRQGAERAIAWFRAGQCEVGLTDTSDSMFARVLRTDGKPTWPFFLRKSTGRLEISLQRLAGVPQFRDEEVRQELLSKFALLPARTFNTGKTTGWPALALEDLLNDDLWQAFTDLGSEILAGIAGAREGDGAA